MKYKLVKLTKTVFYNIIKAQTDLHLPKLKECEFKKCYRSNAGWMYFDDYVIFLDVCAGQAYLRIRKDDSDVVVNIASEWLMQQNLLRRVA